MKIEAPFLDATKEKVAKINERAQRKGWTGRLVVVAEPVQWETYNHLSGITVKHDGYEVSIEGTPPKYNGWTFLARVEWTPDGKSVLASAPGVEDARIDRLVLRPGACDHCHTNRQRNVTFVVEHDNGGQVQVGSTCIKDFLGWSASVCWFKYDAGEIFDGIKGIEPVYDTLGVLAVAWACIKLNGFAPAASDYPTKYQVLDVLNPTYDRARELATKVRPLVDEAYETAGKMLDWVRNLNPGTSDYLINLQNVASGDHLFAKHFGLLVSAPQAYAKARERDLTRRAERAETKDGWLGKPGDKLADVEVTVTGYRPIYGDWGTSHLYTLRTSDGYLLKWFANRDALGEDTGVKATLASAKIKKHDEYKRPDENKGQKQTVVYYVKVAA